MHLLAPLKATIKIEHDQSQENTLFRAAQIISDLNGKKEALNRRAFLGPPS